MKKLLYILSLTLCMGFVSCSDDNEPSSQSIFTGETVTRDALDLWLLDNYSYPYNIDFKYKMEDIESDMKYTLVPADSAKAAKLAIIVKFLWLDAYTEVVGQDFIKTNVPRQIHLIGSPAYNSEGTMVLGTAEGGYKITLYMVNELTDEMLHDYNTLNEYYFHTIHHEFTHILHQRKPYDTSWDLISEGDFVSGDWYQYKDEYAWTHGFVTPYGMSEPQEDFAEMMSVYVTITPEEWQAKVDGAGEEGAKLEKKLEFVKSYMKDSWNLDLDELRTVVLRRAQELKTLDLEHLK